MFATYNAGIEDIITGEDVDGFVVVKLTCGHRAIIEASSARVGIGRNCGRCNKLFKQSEAGNEQG